MTSIEPELHVEPFSVALPFVIRLARPDDLPKLEWYGQYTHFRTVFRRTYRDQLAGRRLMIIADCNGFPVGQIFMQTHREPKNGDIPHDRRTYFYSLRVMDMFQGEGVGSRLLEAAEQIAATYGYQWATIAAAKDNPRARELYERRGYRAYMEDLGNWSYVDHEGRTRHVHEPCWVLEKQIRVR